MEDGEGSGADSPRGWDMNVAPGRGSTRPGWGGVSIGIQSLSSFYLTSPFNTKRSYQSLLIEGLPHCQNPAPSTGQQVCRCSISERMLTLLGFGLFVWSDCGLLACPFAPCLVSDIRSWGQLEVTRVSNVFGTSGPLKHTLTRTGCPLNQKQSSHVHTGYPCFHRCHSKR